MIYHSKTPRKYYQFPNGFVPPGGSLQLYTPNGKHLLADAAAISSFEISKAEAQQELGAELNRFVDGFLKGFTSKAETDTMQPGGENDTMKGKGASISAKVTEGVDFITDLSGMIRALLAAAATEDEKELATTRLNMREIAERLKERGIPVNDDLENLPFTLKERYRNEGKAANLQKGAAELKAATDKLSLSLKSILEAIRHSKNREADPPQ